MRGPKTTKYKNITRIDHPPKRTYGYNVRVAWKGLKYGKFFSDNVYGDRLGALAAAIEWRNAKEKEIGKPRTEYQVNGWNSRNKLGIPGIRRIRKNPSTECFEVTWMIYGEKRRKGATSVSINKYGEKRALKKAIRIRQRAEQMRLRSPKVRQDPPKEPTYRPWLPI